MAIKPIVRYGDPVLRGKNPPAEEMTAEIKELVSDLSDTLKDARGLGLAAPQIGVAKRVFVVDLSAVDITAEIRVFVNPEIVESSGMVEYEEGCLSFPGIYQNLTRPEWVKVKALDLTGNEFVLEADGLLARAILHEYDHLDGILFIDHFSTISKTLVERKLKRLAKSA